MVAKQWKGFNAQEKKAWKDRAQATHVGDEDEEETELAEQPAVEGLGCVHHLDGEAEATAAADAVYQQTVAEMEEAAEEEIDEDVDDSEGDDREVEVEEDDQGEEDEPEGTPGPSTRRRRGRPKKT